MPCYVCAAMSETTTIRLAPKLRSRLRAIAKDTDRSVHSIIVEAVEKHAAYEENMRSLIKEALAADADLERGGEAHRAADVHAWAQKIAQGVASPRPPPWRK
jgi:predicted transcriptional regulator